MSRSLSDLGLHDLVYEWLDEFKAVRIGNYKVEEFYQYLTYPIYRLNDGRIVEEYEQFSMWDGGPHIYRAIRNAHTKEPIEETLWNERFIRGNYEY